MASQSSIAMNRFGLGTRPGDASPADPRGWVAAQIARYRPITPAIAGTPRSPAVAAELARFYADRRATMQAGGSAAEKVDVQQLQAAVRRQGRDTYGALLSARVAESLVTPVPFMERVVHFWANHFAVSADKITVIGLAGTLETEAIRPHAAGRFVDMLLAVERHPAMLLYLDGAVSIGPDSRAGLVAGARGRRVGLNENLAREILELHTLGVRTGYGQADVAELARALTGWTVTGLARGPAARFVPAGEAGSFAFAPALHQPGLRTILGRTYPEGGEEQARAALEALARHPATARHCATKLARHFAGDQPPPAMVARLEQAWIGSDGDLPTVYRALIASPEAWVTEPVKFRSPWEWSIAAMRALGLQSVPPLQAVALMAQVGQPVWRPGNPAGWDDLAATWAAPDALMRRVEAAERLAARVTVPVDARGLAQKLFPGSLSEATATAIARADSPGMALALLLVAPEMVRR